MRHFNDHMVPLHTHLWLVLFPHVPTLITWNPLSEGCNLQGVWLLRHTYRYACTLPVLIMEIFRPPNPVGSAVMLVEKSCGCRVDLRGDAAEHPPLPTYLIDDDAQCVHPQEQKCRDLQGVLDSSCSSLIKS